MKQQKIKAVGYVRVSTDAQGEEIREYSQRQGPGPKGLGRR